MADESELYLENLDEFVNDEDKIVTYKWLSRTLSVPVNKAKQMLYTFVEKQKALNSECKLNITYLIGGKCIANEDTAYRFAIIQEKDLEETKKTFSLVTSIHIYSVQRCKLKDSNSLCTVDYEVQQQHKNEDNRWSHICCPFAKHPADNGILRGNNAHHVNGVGHDDKKASSSKMVNGESDVSHTSKGAALRTEQKSKASGAKAGKGQMSALEMFAAKASTSKPEKSGNKKESIAREGNSEPKAAETTSSGNEARSMKSFFGRNMADSTVKKNSDKLSNIEAEIKGTFNKIEPAIPEKRDKFAESKNRKKRELSSDDEEDPLPAKLSKTVKSDSKVCNVSKSDKIKKQDDKEAERSKSTKAGRKKAVTSESDEEPEEKPKKRRKRMKELPKEDSSDNDDTEEGVTNAESEKKPGSDQHGSTRTDDLLPHQQARQACSETVERRRKRKRELKSKTYMDDQGFMVTEKVWESDSTDASEDELKITSEPHLREKPLSPAKKTNKKIHADIKNKGAKQASLISFFKKS